MLELLYVVFAILYATAKGITNGYHFKEKTTKNYIESSKANKLWHRWQALEQGLVLLVLPLLIMFVPIINWSLIPLMIFSFWFVFDGLIAKRMGKKWFYQGTTSAMDKKLGKWSNAFEIGLLTASIITYTLLNI